MRMLRQYTQLHYQGGRLDLEEDYDPETGKPIVILGATTHPVLLASDIVLVA